MSARWNPVPGLNGKGQKIKESGAASVMRKPIKLPVRGIHKTNWFKDSTISVGSVTSLRLSQAATFDTLRARLTNSQTQLMNQRAPFDVRTYHSHNYMLVFHTELLI